MEQSPVTMGRHRPADDSATESIEPHRNVKKSGPDWDVGGIGHRQEIGRGDEVTFDRVGRRSRVTIPHGAVTQWRRLTPQRLALAWAYTWDRRMTSLAFLPQVVVGAFRASWSLWKTSFSR
jgi:hypothetical protein